MDTVGVAAWLVLIVAVAAGQSVYADPSVASTRLRIRFSPETGGIAGLRTVDGGHDFVRQPAPRPLLWRLALRDRAGAEVTVDNARASRPAFRQGARALTIAWDRVDLPGEPGALDVRATCSLPAAGDTALLRLWVTNRSKTRGLWNVQFPVVAPLSAAGEADVAIGRGNWGELYRAAREPVSGQYPSHNCPLQLMLLNEGDRGLYLACHDPGAMPKTFDLAPGGEFRVTTPAADMGVPGSGWKAPYAFALGVFRGDWMAGCKRYRAWVLKGAPWTRKGPLAARTDVTASIRSVCAWLLADGARETVVPQVRAFAKAMGAPVGVHWYNWHAIPFDTDYPAYFPTKPGFAEGVRELTREGVVVMPYINARLWDSGNKEFPQARPASAKDEKGQPLIEEYGSGAKLAVMCPTQPFWQRRVGEIIRRLGEECGVNAVYMDQIGSAAPRTCFDASHGHPIGSGRWWVDGYRQMLSPIKSWATSGGRQVGLTTENDAEPYMDNVDGFLVWTPRDDGEIPMTTAVYGGYALYFASNRALVGGDDAFCLCQARDVTWGTQPGWEGAALLEPAHAPALEYLGRMARLRERARDYLVTGELLEVLQPTGDVPDLTATWNTWQGDRPVTLKAVHGALWRGRDGSVGIILANADTKAHAFACTVDADRLGLRRAPRWGVELVGAEGRSELPDMAGRAWPLRVDVPARDGVLLVLRPGDGGTRT